MAQRWRRLGCLASASPPARRSPPSPAPSSSPTPPSSRTASTPRVRSARSLLRPGRRRRRARLRGRRALRLRHLPLLRAAGCTRSARRTRRRATRPSSGQLLQTYQGTVEGKLTLRFGQTSIFAEGGVGAARMSTNLLYALGLARYRTGLHGGRRRRHRLPLAVAPLLDRPARRLLLAARRQRQPGPDRHHLPEVHVLMRGPLRPRCCWCVAGALARRRLRDGRPRHAARGRQRLPPQPAVLRRRDLAERSWPRTTAAKHCYDASCHGGAPHQLADADRSRSSRRPTIPLAAARLGRQLHAGHASR